MGFVGSEKLGLIVRIPVKGNRWGSDQMILGDIDTVAITRKGLEWVKTTTKKARASTSLNSQHFFELHYLNLY